MAKILTLFIAISLCTAITSCEKAEDTSSIISLSGTAWQISKEEFSLKLYFVNDSICTITTGAIDGRYGVNHSKYTYKKAYGIDLMIFNHSTVEYTVNFINENTLQLSRSINNNNVQEPLVLDKLR